MLKRARAAFLTVCFTAAAIGQTSENAPNVASVLPYSATYSVTYPTDDPSHPVVVNLANALAGVYAEQKPVNLNADASPIFNPANYGQINSVLEVTHILNVNIATALSILPLPSPASGVILRTDPVTGAPLPVSSTLGPIFTERAETLGKHRFHIALTHQDFHFTSYNGQSLNGLGLLFPGGQQSNITLNNTTQTVVPGLASVGMDVRLSQNVAFLTYGLTDHLDVSVALPLVHSAVAARTYNSTIFGGAGTGNPVCWCADTGLPGKNSLFAPVIGQSNMGRTGFGDILFRVKGTIVDRPSIAVALGTDLRLPTGDELNYLGTGAISVRPFAAISLYTKPMAHGIVFAPHLNVGWQFSGKSTLGGDLRDTVQTISIPGAGQLSYSGAPYTFSKGYLPDVVSWAVGSEVALGSRNTVVVDVLGNQIGWINGVPSARNISVGSQVSPIPPYSSVPVSGLVARAAGSFGEYSAALGYKAKVIGNLVATFNVLIRLDNNGLVARAVPLYGLGYTF